MSKAIVKLIEAVTRLALLRVCGSYQDAGVRRQIIDERLTLEKAQAEKER